jgi:hypothetical protein
MVKIHETKTVHDLTQMAFDAVCTKLATEDPSVSVSRVRLCVFDSIRGILLGPLGEASTELRQLPEEMLRKPLQLEVRCELERCMYCASNYAS